jgi:hypothetical protein
LTGIILCGLAFLTAFCLGMHSLGHGMGAVLGWGYFYGILRCNFLDAGTQFIYDAAVAGLYLVCLVQAVHPQVARKSSPIIPWLFVLIGWPLLLTLVPRAPLIIQLVGFRASAYYLLFLLVGARADAKSCAQIGKWLAVLNLLVLIFGLLEYVNGVEQFYPRNVRTAIIYRSDAGVTENLRIPGTFVNAQSYGAAMVISLPFLLMAYLQKPSQTWFWILVGGTAAAVIGLLLSACRAPMAILGAAFFLVCVRDPSIITKGAVTKLILVMVFVAAWFVRNGDERVNRFKEIGEVKVVQNRLGNPMVVVEYSGKILAQNPMGKGIANGVSIPYFLTNEVEKEALEEHPESEYIHITVTQGFVGILIWLSFLVWFALRPLPRGNLVLLFMHSLALMEYVCGIWGVGISFSIPLSAVLYFIMGMVSQRHRSPTLPPRPPHRPGVNGRARATPLQPQGEAADQAAGSKT